MLADIITTEIFLESIFFGIKPLITIVVSFIIGPIIIECIIKRGSYILFRIAGFSCKKAKKISKQTSDILSVTGTLKDYYKK